MAMPRKMPAPSKVLYDVDPHNRLIVKKTGRRANVRGFRQIVHGRFKTDSKNKLYYELYKSSGATTPQKIRFSGNYSLDKRHNLILTLNKWNRKRHGGRLRMRTGIVHANGHEIVFLMNTRATRRRKSAYIMRLHGSWQVDSNNRLTFGVKKQRDKIDNLTLFNAWKINKNNEIAYSYGRDSKIITLKGSWRIKDRQRLSYALDKGINSGFDFRTSLGRVVMKAKKPYIRFDIAIDISKKKRIRRKIVFTCKRRIGKGRDITLEVSPGKRSASLKLTNEILGNKGLAYIESYLKDREGYLGGGAAFRW